MNTADVAALARRYARSMIVVFILVTAAMTAGLMMQKPVYQSSATVFFTVKSEGAAGQLREAMDYASSQAKTYGQLAQTPTILDPAGAKLNPPMSGIALADHTKVSVNEDTAQLSINTSAPSAQLAADMANAEASEIQKSVTAYSAKGAGGVLEAQIVRPGAVPSSPSSPSLPRNLGIGILAGLAFAIAQALIRWRLDSTITLAADVTRATDVPLIGELPYDRTLSRSGTVFCDDNFAPRVEALRRLRTNMQFIDATRHSAPWLVTSSLPGEGKTTTAVGIAKAYADAGQRVLLMDADLRRPRVADLLGIEGSVGLTTALTHWVALEDVVQTVANFDVLAAGQVPPNPTELLGSDAMSTLIADAHRAYDVVIIDSPPVLPVADASVLSRLTGPVLVVAGSGSIKRGQLQKAVKMLQSVGASVAGISLNKIRTAGEEGYGYKYSYRYEPHENPTSVAVTGSR